MLLPEHRRNEVAMMRGVAREGRSIDRIETVRRTASGRIIAVRELDAGEPPMTVVMNWRRLLEK